MKRGTAIPYLHIFSFIFPPQIFYSNITYVDKFEKRRGFNLKRRGIIIKLPHCTKKKEEEKGSRRRGRGLVTRQPPPRLRELMSVTFSSRPLRLFRRVWCFSSTRRRRRTFCCGRLLRSRIKPQDTSPPSRLFWRAREGESWRTVTSPGFPAWLAGAGPGTWRAPGGGGGGGWRRALARPGLTGPHPATKLRRCLVTHCGAGVGRAAGKVLTRRAGRGGVPAVRREAFPRSLGGRAPRRAPGAFRSALRSGTDFLAPSRGRGRSWTPAHGSAGAAGHVGPGRTLSCRPRGSAGNEQLRPGTRAPPVFPVLAEPHPGCLARWGTRGSVGSSQPVCPERVVHISVDFLLCKISTPQTH